MPRQSRDARAEETDEVRDNTEPTDELPYIPMPKKTKSKTGIPIKPHISKDIIIGLYSLGISTIKCNYDGKHDSGGITDISTTPKDKVISKEYSPEILKLFDLVMDYHYGKWKEDEGNYGEMTFILYPSGRLDYNIDNKWRQMVENASNFKGNINDVREEKPTFDWKPFDLSEVRFTTPAFTRTINTGTNTTI